MEATIPPRQSDLGPTVKRQVVERPPMRRTRQRNPGKLYFLMFLVGFLLMVFWLLITG